ncbi:MAG: hypothetical protein WDO70_01170 [Alphaproteobacteria bacterium]
MKDSQDRYMNLDGSPYGSKRIMRFLAMPSVYTGVPIAIAFAAAKAMCEPPGMRRAVFLSTVYRNLLTPMVSTIMMRSLNLSAPGVIDRAGGSGNPQASAIAMFGYKMNSFLFPAAGALWSAADIASDHPWTAAANIPQMLVNAVWCYRAARKLYAGEWTVQTEPPKIEEKKKEKSSLLDAFRPPTSTASMCALPRPAP